MLKCYCKDVEMLPKCCKVAMLKGCKVAEVFQIAIGVLSPLFVSYMV